MFSRKYSRQSGFTLIELMVAVVIIGILSTVASTSLLSAQRNARDTNRKGQVNAISTAVETYYRVKSRFPGQLGTSTQPSGTYTAETEGCEVYDPVTYSFVYAYFPTLTSAASGNRRPCYNRNSGAPLTSGSYTYTPNDYKPFPVWIPGMGDYLTPTPQEKRYLGRGSSSTNPYDVSNDPFRSGTSNVMRTYAYRKLENGYMVYTVLEGDSRDAVQLDPATNTKIFTDAPKYPNTGNVTVYVPRVYLIRK